MSTRVSGGQATLVAKSLEGGRAGHRQGRRLLERQVGRPGREVPLDAGHELGERPGARAKHRIPRAELGHLGADGRDLACDVHAQPRLLRPAPALPGADDERVGGGPMPVEGIDRCCPHPDEHALLVDVGDRNVRQLEEQR
jgi:hypothetical protein